MDHRGPIIFVIFILIVAYVLNNKKKRVLWVAYSTDNYEPVTKYWRESLKAVINTDSDYDHVIKHKVDTVPEDEKTGFGTYIWYRCLIKKLEWAISMEEYAKEFDYIVISDCDVQFFSRNSWKPLFEYIDNSNKSIFFMRENVTWDVNCGFYIIKRDYYETYVKFLKYMFENNNMYTGLGDQTYFNKNLDKLNFDYIPDKYFIWGPDIHRHNKSSAFFHHAVISNDTDTKVNQFKMIKLYVEHDN